MRHGKRWAAFGACVMLALAPLAANAQAEKAPDEMTGIDVGEKAPGFSLKGHDGKTYTLSDLIEEGPVALVFYRSANW